VGKPSEAKDAEEPIQRHPFEVSFSFW